MRLIIKGGSQPKKYGAEIWAKTRFFALTVSMRVFSKKRRNLCWNDLILFFTPENMGIGTKNILIPWTVTEILTKEGCSVMAAFCILGGLSKDDRVASLRFLKSTPQRYSKTNCTDGIARFSKNLGFGNRTKWNHARYFTHKCYSCFRNVDHLLKCA